MPNNDRAALQRLDRILADENYGPKLARMTRSQERQVLALIEQNRGKEARQTILDIDSRSRQVRRTKDRVREYSRKSEAERRRLRASPSGMYVGSELYDDNDAADLDDDLFWDLYDLGMA